jgi:hypothetical protein
MRMSWLYLESPPICPPVRSPLPLSRSWEYVVRARSRRRRRRRCPILPPARLLVQLVAFYPVPWRR